MKTLIEYRPKSIVEHYVAIKEMFENWGATVLGVTHTFSETDDPGVGFVVTLKGQKTSMLEHFAEQVMVCYAYRIEWAA